MSINPSDVYTRVNSLLQFSGTALLYPASVLSNALEAAMLWHSQFKSRQALWLGTADGAAAIFDLPDDLIAIRKVESPYGGTPPNYLSAIDWALHQGTAGFELVLNEAPGSGDLFGVHYNGTWGTPDLSSDALIPMAYLSCAFLSIREAARFAGNVSPLIEADVVDYRSQSSAWVRLSEEFMGMYAKCYSLSVKQVQQGAPSPAFGIGAIPAHARYERFWWITE